MEKKVFIPEQPQEKIYQDFASIASMAKHELIKILDEEYEKQGYKQENNMSLIMFGTVEFTMAYLLKRYRVDIEACKGQSTPKELLEHLDEVINDGPPGLKELFEHVLASTECTCPCTENN